MTAQGVLLRVDQTGVLITGPAGAGKSRLALELIARGHALVADDLVEIRVENGAAIGHPPEGPTGFLAVRGAGILNIRRLYGDASICTEHRIDLVVEPGEGIEPFADERPQRTIAGVPLPLLHNPDLAHAAALVEAVARDLALRRDGYDAATDLEQQQAARLNPEARVRHG